MKKIFYLVFILPMFLLSCEKKPEASFYLDGDIFQISQDIVFINNSHNATRYEWDFGDGYISNESQPVHSYQLAGTYEVVLTAISKNGGENKTSMSITLVEPSLLVVEVLEYYSGNPVSGASVILYPSLADWDNQTNMIIEGITASDGVIVFANLDPIAHYVDVWEQNHDNFGLRQEDVGFIQTPKVVPNTVQWFVAYVDIVQHTKGDGRVVREAVIKKLERKAGDRPLSKTNLGTEGWQELYKRSVWKK
jgi:PKD repeat protein